MSFSTTTDSRLVKKLEIYKSIIRDIYKYFRFIIRIIYTIIIIASICLRILPSYKVPPLFCAYLNSWILKNICSRIWNRISTCSQAFDTQVGRPVLIAWEVRNFSVGWCGRTTTSAGRKYPNSSELWLDSPKMWFAALVASWMFERCINIHQIQLAVIIPLLPQVPTSLFSSWQMHSFENYFQFTAFLKNCVYFLFIHGSN